MTDDRTSRMELARGWLIGIGCVVLAFAGLNVLGNVAPWSYPGIATWLVAALVIHDGVIALAVFGTSLLLRRAGRRIPVAVIVIVQVWLVVGVVVTAIALPQAVGQALGVRRNPSVLPLDYAGNLLAFHVGLAASGVLAVAVALAVAGIRRRRARS